MGERAVFDDVLIYEPLTHPCVKGFLLHKKGTFLNEMFPF